MRIGEIAVAEIARASFLDEPNPSRCVETTFIVLKGACGLDDPSTRAEMALNGGVSDSGGAGSARPPV